MAYQTRAFNMEEDKGKLSILWQEKSEKNLQRRFDYMCGSRANRQVKTSLLFDEKSQETVGVYRCLPIQCAFKIRILSWA